LSVDPDAVNVGRTIGIDLTSTSPTHAGPELHAPPPAEAVAAWVADSAGAAADRPHRTRRAA
jgi:hypothetical protein